MTWGWRHWNGPGREPKQGWRIGSWESFRLLLPKGYEKKPLICMSFAVACQGFLPVEAIFAATLGFRLRQCGNQLAILAQNYGMDQWIAVTMVRDSCCLLPVWIGQCPMAMNMLELPLLSSGKTEKWGSAVFKSINTVADLDSEILTATAANVFCIICQMESHSIHRTYLTRAARQAFVGGPCFYTWICQS